jgi:hypothetical protein
LGKRSYLILLKEKEKEMSFSQTVRSKNSFVVAFSGIY